jgi:hypothetical protein
MAGSWADEAVGDWALEPVIYARLFDLKGAFPEILTGSCKRNV